MEEFSDDSEISLISKGLFRIISDVLGAECIVKIGRQQWDTINRLHNCDTSAVQRIVGGSRAEGFNFKSSDIDTMYIDRDVSVWPSSNCLCVQQPPSSSLFLMEHEECSPGFTLLRCLVCNMKNATFNNSLVRKGNYLYLSSSAIVQSFLSPSIREIHGPCKSANLLGIEADHAYTMKCPVWPYQALPFVSRSIEKGWPSYDVVMDICNDGCLFVPIKSRQQTFSDQMDLEWRISFALAEKKIIYSMNRCQFLCYGLLKLLLNEVLKEIPPIKDLLCSYFMKTAVFWEIYDRFFDWSMKTFLSKFWKVFRRLIQWVSVGYCPNFFIPEDNMFIGKIFGGNQRKLLSVLRGMYSDGFMCLLASQSLNVSFSMIISQPLLANMLSYEEADYVSVFDIDREAFRVLLSFTSFCPSDNLDEIEIKLNRTLHMRIESEEMMSAKRLRVKPILQQYAELSFVSLLHPKCNCSRNKEHYKGMKAAQTIQCKTKTFFCSNFLNYAKSVYMSGNYSKVIDILHYVKHKLQSRPFMYWWRLDDDLIIATRQQGLPFQAIIESFTLNYIEMTKYTPIEEIRSECHAIAEELGGYLFVPPLVFINFLLVLSYTRVEENHRRHDVMFELNKLLYHDDGIHILSVAEDHAV